MRFDLVNTEKYNDFIISYFCKEKIKLEKLINMIIDIIIIYTTNQTLSHKKCMYIIKNRDNNLIVLFKEENGTLRAQSRKFN